MDANSPRQRLKKCIENSVENMPADIRELMVKRTQEFCGKFDRISNLPNWSKTDFQHNA